MKINLQAYKACLYLFKVNPKRHRMKRFYDSIILIDTHSRQRHHTRRLYDMTQINSFYGHVPLYSFKRNHLGKI